MGIEFELKFKANEAQLAKICADLCEDTRTYQMQSTYYDTACGDFSARRCTLRCRRENEKSICTLKTPKAGAARGEFEVEGASVAEALPILCKLSGEQELQALAHSQLLEVCGARFTRIAKLLLLEGCTAELALDRGVLTGAGKELPLCEAELELKSGSENQLLHFAQEFAERYQLQEEKLSKFRRALDLAKGE